jgi:RES domain-containing protein
VDRNLAVAVSSAKISAVEGVFQRHASPTVRTLTGSASGGRWGPPAAYSVLYLGRPEASVVGEAYRALVDDVEGMTGELVGPRRLFTCEVTVTQILDLREPESQEAVGLTLEDLMGPWAPCQRIGRAAHQLELHGVIAPAATGLGETLALFEHHLPESELPRFRGEQMWASLPPDPRPLHFRGLGRDRY